MYTRINVELMDVDGETVEDALSEFYGELYPITSPPRRVVSNLNNTIIINDPLRGIHEKDEEVYALFMEHNIVVGLGLL